MIGRSNLSKGGGSADVVNGIIEQYLSENSTIDANTFVEFVNHYYNDVTLDSNEYSFERTSAVLIDTNRVFIAHNKANTNSNIMGTVCTISGNTITVDINTSIYNNTASHLAVVLIETNKVLVAYRDAGSNNYLYGVVCTISGNTLTKGTATRITSTYSSVTYISSVLVDTNKVFITFQSTVPCAVVCIIDGNTITSGTAISLNNTSGSYPSLALVDTNKVFITTKYNSNGYLGGRISTVSGTTITNGTETVIVNNNYSTGNVSSTLIDTNKVFVTHQSDNTNKYLQGIICTISGTTITKGTDTQLSNDAGSSNGNKIITLDTNKAFIVHSSESSTGYLSGLICTVSGTTITTGTDTNLSTNVNSYGSDYGNPAPVLLGSNNIFIAHRSGSTNYLNGLLCSVNGTTITTTYEDPTIKPSVNRIDGLTKTEATTSTAGDVWVLDNE